MLLSIRGTRPMSRQLDRIGFGTGRLTKIYWIGPIRFFVDRTFSTHLLKPIHGVCQQWVGLLTTRLGITSNNESTSLLCGRSGRCETSTTNVITNLLTLEVWAWMKQARTGHSSHFNYLFILLLFILSCVVILFFFRQLRFSSVQGWKKTYILKYFFRFIGFNVRGPEWPDTTSHRQSDWENNVVEVKVWLNSIWFK